MAALADAGPRKRRRFHNAFYIFMAVIVLANYKTLQHKFRNEFGHKKSTNGFSDEKKQLQSVGHILKPVQRASAAHCDVRDYRTDICYLSGDVRVNAAKRMVEVANAGQDRVVHKIRPYTRKWESECMETVREITLLERSSDSGLSPSSSSSASCDVQHSVPGLIFSTSGYSGSLFHDFTDGLVPLFITSQRFKGEVVLLVSEHKGWWVKKYSRILGLLSHYPVVNLDKSRQIHCFPELVVGLRHHGDLQIKPVDGDSSAIDGTPTMKDFQLLLKKAFDNATSRPEPTPIPASDKPRLVFMARNESRVLLNQDKTLKLARRIGFDVEVLTPDPKTDLAFMYSKVHSAQVMLGVHGAALTHFLFMKPGSVLIQIVPLGLGWPSKTYFAKSAPKAGMRYLEYRILPSESTLLRKLGPNHTLVTGSDKDTTMTMSWWDLKKVYLDNQDIKLSLKRFEMTLRQAFLLASSSRSM